MTKRYELTPEKIGTVTVIESKRKTVSLELLMTGEILLRVPFRYGKKRSEELLEKRSAWILKTREKLLLRQQEALRKQQEQQTLLDHGAQKTGQRPLTKEDLRRLKKEAQAYFPKRLEYYAAILGTDYGKVSYRCQKSRWGSCSSKGNISLNIGLMLTPERVRDYVAVHELCHRFEMNHSARFWKSVESVMPDYKEQRAFLKENGFWIIQQMCGLAKK